MAFIVPIHHTRFLSPIFVQYSSCFLLQLPILELLLLHGADLESKTKNGESPLGKKPNYINSVIPKWFSISSGGLRGIVVMVWAGGRAGGCQTCGTHITVTAWQILSVRNSVELSRPVVLHCHGHVPICPISACPWANLPQIGSKLCGTHFSETTGWIYPI